MLPAAPPPAYREKELLPSSTVFPASIDIRMWLFGFAVFNFLIDVPIWFALVPYNKWDVNTGLVILQMVLDAILVHAATTNRVWSLKLNRAVSECLLVLNITFFILMCLVASWTTIFGIHPISGRSFLTDDMTYFNEVYKLAWGINFLGVFTIVFAVRHYLVSNTLEVVEIERYHQNLVNVRYPPI